MVVAIAVSTVSFAQTIPTTPTSPATPQTVPTQDPTTGNPSENPTTEKKAEFNSPQSPVKPTNTPSEDTLIKSQRVGGAIIRDTITPTSGKRGDKMSRRKGKKAASEADTASVKGLDPNKRP